MDATQTQTSSKATTPQGTESTQAPATATTATPVNPQSTSQVLRSFESSSSTAPKGNMQGSQKIFFFLCFVVILSGVATGAGINKLRANNAQGETEVYQGQRIQQVAGDTVQNGQIFGSANEKDFKDSAEGYLQAGGIAGEGTHHLLRDGGPSQTVYMTSSVTDLDKFVGMKVKVWGETQKGQRVGWLMDVGRVEIKDTEAAPPTEE